MTGHAGIVSCAKSDKHASRRFLQPIIPAIAGSLALRVEPEHPSRVGPACVVVLLAVVVAVRACFVQSRFTVLT